VGVILADTSAWVEFLRDARSEVCMHVDELLDSEFAICHPVRMEVLAGGRDERHLSDLRGLLARGVLLPTQTSHYETAAALYRACRRQGQSIRRLIDCLIAAHATDAGAQVVHADSDVLTTSSRVSRTRY